VIRPVRTFHGLLNSFEDLQNYCISKRLSLYLFIGTAPNANFSRGFWYFLAITAENMLYTLDTHVTCTGRWAHARKFALL
jgi:hypothetical protein